MIFSTIRPAHVPPGHNHPGCPVTNPFAILSQLINPANAQQGDAVFSQEALDRVTSQLMEQNAGSKALPPASQDAIPSLPTQKDAQRLLSSEARAESSL